MEKVVAEYNILRENKYNMDESGYAIGEIEATKFIINANIRQQFQKQTWSSRVGYIGGMYMCGCDGGRSGTMHNDTLPRPGGRWIVGLQS